MLTGIHFLLTYECVFECDHCFLFSKPGANGTFTFDQVEAVLDQSVDQGSINEIYFEGGEPFLYYQLMIEGIKAARIRGFKVGVVSNCYWANTERDAELWLRPLKEAGISSISLSDDAFHHEDESNNPAKRALAAARKMEIEADAICIEGPTADAGNDSDRGKGEPVVGGGVLFKGRAVDKLVSDLPRRPYTEFDSCPHEDFIEPKRVHADSYGHLHICQGVSMGNIWQSPLRQVIEDYDPHSHPVIGPLANGGPLALSQKYGIEHEGEYVDACHFCFQVRRALIDKFPDCLTPRQVYDME